MTRREGAPETGGDLEAAVDWLRKKGLAAAAKKAGRVAAEGLIGMKLAGPAAAMVEVNSETDFVARNDRFQDFVSTAADLALTGDGTVEGLKATTFPSTDHTVSEEVTRLVATIGENINLRRAAKLTVESGVVAGYVHNAVAPGLGKIGVLVALESTGDAAKLDAFGKQLAMHVAAARPDAVTTAEVDPSALERERNVLADQARASGKPEAIIEKMVEGRLRKYYEDVVLLEQTWVIDNETKVGKVIEGVAKEVGAPVTVKSFVRFTLGEGIEKSDSDFAAEVAASLSR